MLSICPEAAQLENSRAASRRPVFLLQDSVRPERGPRGFVWAGAQSRTSKRPARRSTVLEHHQQPAAQAHTPRPLLLAQTLWGDSTQTQWPRKVAVCPPPPGRQWRDGVLTQVRIPAAALRPSSGPDGFPVVAGRQSTPKPGAQEGADAGTPQVMPSPYLCR